MATQTEKLLQQQEVELVRLRGHVDTLRAEVAQLRPLDTEVSMLKGQLTTLSAETAQLRETAKEIPVLKHQVAELSKVKEAWGQRIWLIATIVLSAFFATLTAILGALLTFTLNAKK